MVPVRLFFQVGKTAGIGQWISFASQQSFKNSLCGPKRKMDPLCLPYVRMYVLEHQNSQLNAPKPGQSQYRHLLQLEFLKSSLYGLIPVSKSTAKISVSYPAYGLGALFHLPKNPSKLVSNPLLFASCCWEKKPKQPNNYIFLLIIVTPLFMYFLRQVLLRCFQWPWDFIW